jgi:2-methylcitrate dehydratase PrpD
MVQTNNESGITRTLGSFAANLNYEDLSPDVVDWAKYLCLDFAGVTLNGSTTEISQDGGQHVAGPGEVRPLSHRGNAIPDAARICLHG